MIAVILCLESRLCWFFFLLVLSDLLVLIVVLFVSMGLEQCLLEVFFLAVVTLDVHADVLALLPLVSPQLAAEAAALSVHLLSV